MSLQDARAIKEQNSIKYNSAFKEHVYILKVKKNGKDWKSDCICVCFNFLDFCDSQGFLQNFNFINFKEVDVSWGRICSTIPRGYLTLSGDIFDCHNWVRDATEPSE